jgi:hypothetical protein
MHFLGHDDPGKLILWLFWFRWLADSASIAALVAMDVVAAVGFGLWLYSATLKIKQNHLRYAGVTGLRLCLRA